MDKKFIAIGIVAVIAVIAAGIAYLFLSDQALLRGDSTPCVPSLISPMEGAVLDNGRTDTLDDIVWDFDWSDCEGASQYHLYVIGSSATIPVIDEKVSESSYHDVSSGSYIIDVNRFNWTWKVRAQIGGQWGEWSETRTFDVEPVNSDPPGA